MSGRIKTTAVASSLNTVAEYSWQSTSRKTWCQHPQHCQSRRQKATKAIFIGAASPITSDIPTFFGSSSFAAMAQSSSTLPCRESRRPLPPRQDLQTALKNESMADRDASNSSRHPAISSTQSLKAHSGPSPQKHPPAANQEAHTTANGTPPKSSSDSESSMSDVAPVSRSSTSQTPSCHSPLPKDGAAGVTGTETNMDRVKKGKPARGRPKGVKNGQGKSGYAALERMRREAVSSNASAHAVHHEAKSDSRTTDPPCSSSLSESSDDPSNPFQGQESLEFVPRPLPNSDVFDFSPVSAVQGAEITDPNCQVLPGVSFNPFGPMGPS